MGFFSFQKHNIHDPVCNNIRIFVHILISTLQISSYFLHMFIV